MHTFAFIRRARVLAVLLSAVLVAACAMPALWRMDCHTTGESELAWVDIEACCHPDVPVQVPELKHHCCDYSHAEAGLDPSEELAVQKHSVVLDVAELAPPPVRLGALSPKLVARSRVEYPPPRPGGDLLIAIGLFRI